jgi:hypothetical protein
MRIHSDLLRASLYVGISVAALVGLAITSRFVH